MLRNLILAAVVAASVAGCSGPAAAPPPSTTQTVVGPPCQGAESQGGRAVAFGPDGDLAGLVFGTGSVGIVYAHESDDTSCSWLKTAATYAKRGYRTLIFDFAGFEASREHAASYDEDVVAAAGFLRAQGATSTVLIGASLGGTAVLVAASKINPPVAGVVALSAPLTYGVLGAVGVTLPPSMPVLLMAASLDGGFPADARSLQTSLGPGGTRDLVIVDSSSLHGFRLVAVDASAPLQSRDALDSFLARFAAV